MRTVKNLANGFDARMIIFSLISAVNLATHEPQHYDLSEAAARRFWVSERQCLDMAFAIGKHRYTLTLINFKPCAIRGLARMGASPCPVGLQTAFGVSKRQIGSCRLVSRSLDWSSRGISENIFRLALKSDRSLAVLVLVLLPACLVISSSAMLVEVNGRAFVCLLAWCRPESRLVKWSVQTLMRLTSAIKPGRQLSQYPHNSRFGQC